jgi:hypothetical protein
VTLSSENATLISFFVIFRTFLAKFLIGEMLSSLQTVTTQNFRDSIFSILTLLFTLQRQKQQQQQLKTLFTTKSAFYSSAVQSQGVSKQSKPLEQSRTMKTKSANETLTALTKR